MYTLIKKQDDKKQQKHVFKHVNTKGVININRVYDGKETVYSKKLRKWTKQRNKCIKKENKSQKI